MRRLWATAASGAVILLSAGCSTEPATTGSATPAVPPVPPSAAAPAPQASPGAGASAGAGAASANAGDVALAGNTDAICKQATKVSGRAAATFATNMKLLVEASTAKSKDDAQQARARTVRDVQNWSFALADLSKLVADKTVKRALADMSKQVTRLQGDVEKIDDAKLANLREQLDKACGRS